MSSADATLCLSCILQRHLEAVPRCGDILWYCTVNIDSTYLFYLLSICIPLASCHTPAQKTAHLLVLGSLQWGRKHQCDPLVNRAVSSLLQALVVCSVLAFPQSTSLSRSATLKGEKEHELFLNSTTWREKITRKANSPIGSMYGISHTWILWVKTPILSTSSVSGSSGSVAIIFSLAQAARSCRIASFTATEAQWSSNINLGKVGPKSVKCSKNAYKYMTYVLYKL